MQHSGGIVPGYMLRFSILAYDIDTSNSDSIPHKTDEEIELGVGEILASIKQVLFQKAGGTSQFTLTSDTNWIIVIDKDWATVDYSSGQGNKAITITCAANATLRSRNAILTISAEYCNDIVISINQAK